MTLIDVSGYMADWPHQADRQKRYPDFLNIEISGLNLRASLEIGDHRGPDAERRDQESGEDEVLRSAVLCVHA